MPTYLNLRHQAREIAVSFSYENPNPGLHEAKVKTSHINTDPCEFIQLSTIERACPEIEVAQLQDILRKHTSTEDMFTQQYVHGNNENIKLLVDIGKTVDNPDAASDMYKKLINMEPSFTASWRSSKHGITRPHTHPVHW